MGIFRRRAKEPPADADLLAADQGLDDTAEQTAGDDEPDHDMEGTVSRVRGPFDREEVGSDDGYIDLGSLWVPEVDGMQLRLEVDKTGQQIMSVQLVLDDSVVQLQAYAAPRTVGVWQQLRTETRQNVLAQGGTVDVTDGPFGKQLEAKLPNGARMRVLGIDGPRWFLRAVLSGAAATDGPGAAAILDVVGKVVVVRGSEAMPPRELLPLRVPVSRDASSAGADDEAAENPQPTGGDSSAVATSRSGKQRKAEDLKPFERGPEITEVR